MGVAGVLLYPLEKPLALFIYLGYQFTFALGSYLVRCETLLFVDNKRLTQLDIAKQTAYLVGMGASWLAYQVFESHFQIIDKTTQVTAIHWPLLAIEILIIFCLTRAFQRSPQVKAI